VRAAWRVLTGNPNRIRILHLHRTEWGFHGGSAGLFRA
jgi:hypothetical protein